MSEYTTEGDDVFSGEDEDVGEGIDDAFANHASTESDPAESEPIFDAHLAPGQIPTEATSAFYREFGQQFGEAEAEALQLQWQDKAIERERLARGLVEDHPDLGEAVEAYVDNGRLTAEGVGVTAQYLMQAGGFDDLNELIERHPTLRDIYWRGMDDINGSLSFAAVYEMLSYIASQSGYKFSHRRST